MAHANNSLITGKFRGSLGKELVFREWEGKTIVSKSPESRSGDPTVAQAETLEKFLLASSLRAFSASKYYSRLSLAADSRHYTALN